MLAFLLSEVNSLCMLLKGRKQEVPCFWSCFLDKEGSRIVCCGVGRPTISSPQTAMGLCLPLMLMSPFDASVLRILVSYLRRVLFHPYRVSLSWPLLSILSGVFFRESFPGLAFVFSPILVPLFITVAKYLTEAIQDPRLVLVRSSRGQSVTVGKAW